MKYKGVIFDLDGTILDTIYDLGNSVNSTLEKYGQPLHTYEEYKKKIGKGFRDLIKRSFPEMTEEIILEQALKDFLEIYDRSYMNDTRPYDGICEVLKVLTANNIKLGINSNKRNDYTNKLVEKFFSDIDFFGVFGERNNIPKKPAPDSALEIAELMNLNPDEILYIGDSKTDILTGHNAGMSSAGVLWGFRDRKEFEENNADYIFTAPYEILELFDI